MDAIEQDAVRDAGWTLIVGTLACYVLDMPGGLYLVPALFALLQLALARRPT